jgi:hypothetical protein
MNVVHEFPFSFQHACLSQVSVFNRLGHIVSLSPPPLHPHYTYPMTHGCVRLGHSIFYRHDCELVIRVPRWHWILAHEHRIYVAGRLHVQLTYWLVDDYAIHKKVSLVKPTNHTCRSDHRASDWTCWPSMTV